MSDSVGEIKSRLSIEDLVSEYVVLKRIGKSLKGLCPFHSEKTPSFIVSPDKGIAYCFGCHKGGDLFKFMMEVESVDFPEALRILAEKTGVVLEKESTKNFVKKSEKEVLIEIHEEVADFYVEKLWADGEGKPALEYLRKRGLSDETIKRFRLGYAPNSYEATHEMLLKKSFSHGHILQSGLALAKDTSMNKVYDRFRGRLMFPVQDGLGRVVGFGGRALLPDQEPKYLNSPETPIYQKSHLLYGFYQAKTAIKAKAKTVVVEGYMDFLAAFQDGLENVVAVNGTAMTTRHLTVLKPYISELILSFDMDNAGKEAAKRSFEVTQDFDFVVKVLTLPSGKDIADFVQTTKGELVKMADHAKLFTEFFYDDLLAKYDSRDISQKKKILAEFAGMFMKLKSSVEKDIYVRKIALELGVPEVQIYDELNMTKLAKSHPAKMAIESQGARKQYTPEELIMGLIMQYPKLFHESKLDLSQEVFSDNLKAIYKQFCTKYNPSGTDQEAVLEIVSGLDDELKSQVSLMSLYVEEKYEGLPEQQVARSMEDLVRKVKLENLSKARITLQRKLKEAESTRNFEEMQTILVKLNELNRIN